MLKQKSGGQKTTNMQSISFRPLRRIKKTGKITVASYTQWRKVMTADYSRFSLSLDDEYRKLASSEYVYDHKGDLLYFFNYNPAEVPVFQWNPLLSIDEIIANNKHYGICWEHGNHVNYNMPGTDCAGVPTFSHLTADYIACSYKDMNDFEPLTVGTVNKWLGWFLWQLNNSYLKIGK